MKVAALVVTNRPRFLKWFTHQIAKQTRLPDEVVVVTNSADATPYFDGKMAERTGVPDTLVYHQAPEKWVSLGWMRQKALDLCASDILLWFDDDDWYHPRRIELCVEPIETGRYDASVLPLTHFYYLRQRQTFTLEGGTGLHLPATAWRKESVQGTRFPHITTGEDCLWINRVAHPKDGTKPLIPTHRIRWIDDYLEPHIGALVIVHGNNTWQTSLEEVNWALPLFDKFGRNAGVLHSFAPKDVTQEEWDLTLRMLDEIHGRQ